MAAWRAPIRQPVMFVLAAAVCGACVGLPLLRHAPSRLLTGRPLGFLALGAPGLALAVAAALLFGVAFWPRSRLGSWIALLAGGRSVSD